MNTEQMDSYLNIMKNCSVLGNTFNAVYIRNCLLGINTFSSVQNVVNYFFLQQQQNTVVYLWNQKVSAADK